MNGKRSGGVLEWWIELHLPTPAIAGNHDFYFYILFSYFSSPVLPNSPLPSLHTPLPPLPDSTTPPPHHSTTPSLHHSITPSLHHSIPPLQRLHQIHHEPRRI